MTIVSHVTAEFWSRYHALPEDVRRQADKAFKRFRVNPSHPSLHLKKAGPFWSARVSLDYRVLGYLENHEFYWFWIGPHDEYDQLLKRR